ncbi:MAG: alanyl-tRNA editing protein, partial [Eubacteriales bacterium]|nr:alanyl-tRNA editing protein [Eubacteriales bacterium]
MDKRKLYQKDAYQKECGAELLSVRENASELSLFFSQTVFCPEGGGQSGDRGEAVFQGADGQTFRLPVADSYEEDGVVWHKVKKGGEPLPESLREILKPGAKARLSIDFAHRFDNMQRHCGEHILSGVLYRLYGAVNKGFHMSDDGIAIDMDFSSSEEITGVKRERITWEMAKTAEWEANKIIWKNEPVHVEYYDTREEAETRPLRKKLSFDRDISIVTIGDFDHPDDCVACCGTHPARTGEVGLIRIFGIEPNKGMSRIFLEAGSRALRITQKEGDILYDLETELSAGTADVLEKFLVLQRKTEETKEQLRILLRQLETREAERILAQAEPNAVFHYGEEIPDADFLFRIAKRLSGKLPGILFLCHDPSNTVVAVSNG